MAKEAGTTVEAVAKASGNLSCCNKLAKIIF
jgi:hypothetical protein